MSPRGPVGSLCTWLSYGAAMRRAFLIGLLLVGAARAERAVPQPVLVLPLQVCPSYRVEQGHRGAAEPLPLTNDARSWQLAQRLLWPAAWRAVGRTGEPEV